MASNPYGTSYDPATGLNPSGDDSYAPPPKPLYDPGITGGPPSLPSTQYLSQSTLSNGTIPSAYPSVGATPSAGVKPPGSVVQNQTSTTPSPPGPGGPAGINWADVFNPPWMGQQSQQWLTFMMGPQGVQFQNQLAQQQEDLQKQIQTAAYTGDWNGMQTLQAQLQNVQIALAQNQSQVNNTLAQSNLTGSYHGAPTLQAQDIMNQLALQARGQDVSMAGIQAQLAQSPLVAWYTARGLPPPTTAIMQGPAAWNPDWNWSERGSIAPGGVQTPPLPPGVSPAA